MHACMHACNMINTKMHVCLSVCLSVWYVSIKNILQYLAVLVNTDARVSGAEIDTNSGVNLLLLAVTLIIGTCHPPQNLHRQKKQQSRVDIPQRTSCYYARWQKGARHDRWPRTRSHCRTKEKAYFFVSATTQSRVVRPFKCSCHRKLPATHTCARVCAFS